MSETSTAERPAGARGFQPYPAYKDSGVKWLKEIPAHWEAVPLFTLARERDVRNTRGEETNVLSLSYGRIVRRDVSDNFGLMPESFDTYQIVEPDNIVLRLTDLQNDQRSLRVGLVLERGIITSAYVALDVVRRITPIWGYYLLHAYDVTKVFYTLGAGVRQTMKFEDLKRMPILVPPDKEQSAIAAFLDREAAKIDSLIKKKVRLIELLQEKRTALITHAVTKGLDPNVPMKASGVEWLGKIPAHWTTKPLKHVAEFINGFAFKPDEWGLEGTPIIRIENLNAGEDFNYTARELPAKYCADEGDLLFGWSGNRGTSFGPFLWWRAGRHYVNQHIFRVVNFDVDKMWLYWMLRGVTFYVEKQAHGIIGMVHITRGELGSIPVPLLPLEEQQQIAQYLDTETTQIDTLIAKVRDGIERLKEYRTALISAAVTGKIDVREEAA